MDRIEVNVGYGPACDGGDENGAGGDVDEAFVHRWIFSVAICECDQRPKYKDVSERDDVEESNVGSAGPAAPEKSVGCGQNAHRDHRTGQQKSGYAEAPVQVYPLCRNQRCLCDKQQNPAREYGTVYVDDAAGEWCVKYSRPIVGWPESNKDGDQHKPGRGGEKLPIIAAA